MPISLAWARLFFISLLLTKLLGHLSVATADTHDKETYLSDTLEGKLLPVEHCLRGTEGHKIVDGLLRDENGITIIPEKHIIQKYTFGSYSLGVELQSLNEEIDEIVICGYCTSICVVANAILLRAKFPNTKITVRADLCGDVTEVSHNAALQVMKMQQIDIKYN